MEFKLEKSVSNGIIYNILKPCEDYGLSIEETKWLINTINSNIDYYVCQQPVKLYEEDCKRVPFIKEQ